MLGMLAGLGLGIVVFIIIVVVGTVIANNLGDAVAGCQAGYIYNGSLDTCQNATGSSNTTTPNTAGWTAANYGQTQLGSTGLLGWTPAIIAVTVGAAFLALLGFRMMQGGKSTL